MKDHIEFLTLHEERTPVVIKNQFEFRKDRPHQWLQRLCFWTLRKLKCYVNSESVSYTRVPVSQTKLIEQIFAQKVELTRRFRRDGTTLLMGAEDYEKLMNSPEIRYNTFNVDTHFRHGDTICGLRVTVIPWMRGMLVLPESVR